MSNSKTSLCGGLAALLVCLGELPGLSPGIVSILHLLTATALGALGYHATDCGGCPGLPARVQAGLAVLLVLALATGCSLGRLTFSAVGSPVGTLRLSIGEGSLGSPVPIPTNFPPVLDTGSNAPAAVSSLR